MSGLRAEDSIQSISPACARPTRRNRTASSAQAMPVNVRVREGKICFSMAFRVRNTDHLQRTERVGKPFSNVRRKSAQRPWYGESICYLPVHLIFRRRGYPFAIPCAARTDTHKHIHIHWATGWLWFHFRRSISRSCRAFHPLPLLLPIISHCSHVLITNHLTLGTSATHTHTTALLGSCHQVPRTAGTDCDPPDTCPCL